MAAAAYNRDRNLLLVVGGGGTATLAAASKVTMGAPDAGNHGSEGIAFDRGNGFKVVAQTSSQQVFSAQLNLIALTSSNGSATAEHNGLFHTAVFNATDLSDAIALTVLPAGLARRQRCTAPHHTDP